MTSDDLLDFFGFPACTPETEMPLSVPVDPNWAPCVPGALGDDRRAFARWLKEWGLTQGAEIGTCGGEFAEVLLNAGHDVACIDPWVIYPGYPDYRRQRTLDRAYAQACARLAPHYGHCQIIKQTSLDAAREFLPGCLDWVFIDANHQYNYVLEDISAWEPKVRKGGIISGQDYAPSDVHEVVEAVQAYTKTMGIRPWFTVGWGGDYTRTWFWAKE